MQSGFLPRPPQIAHSELSVISGHPRHLLPFLLGHEDAPEPQTWADFGLYVGNRPVVWQEGNRRPVFQPYMEVVQQCVLVVVRAI